MDWTPEQRQRVADAVKARRAALNLTQEEAIARSGGNPSLPVWSIIENAKQNRFKPRTLHGVCAALDWLPDQIDRILRGEQPATRPVGDDPLVELRSQVAELSARLDTMQAQLEAVTGVVAETTSSQCESRARQSPGGAR